MSRRSGIAAIGLLLVSPFALAGCGSGGGGGGNAIGSAPRARLVNQGNDGAIDAYLYSTAKPVPFRSTSLIPLIRGVNPGATSDFVTTGPGEQRVTIARKADATPVTSGTVTFRENTDTRIILEMHTDPATGHPAPDLRFEVTNR